MRAKTHLANSYDPLKEGTTIKALCEADVINSAFIFSWEPEQVGTELESDLKVCRKCRNRLVTAQCLPIYSYLYGIISGEEQKQSEVEAS